MPPNPEPYSQRNADGSWTPLIRLLGYSEALKSAVEVTLDGFTVKSIQGTYMYLEYNETSHTMLSTGLVAGRDDPSQVRSKMSGKMLNKNEHASMKSSTFCDFTAFITAFS